jgi:hypothetical protein
MTPLSRAILEFSPLPGAAAPDMNAAWASGQLHVLLGPRAWTHVVTVGGNETLPETLARLREAFVVMGIMPDESHRGAVLVPDGTHVLGDELNLSTSPWFDLIGQSRSRTIVTCGAHTKRATIYAKGTHSMIAHMTVRRTGDFHHQGGNGVRYAIHDNTPSDRPRNVLFVDLDCQTPDDTGIGTGICAGGTHLYVNVNSDNGFFAHNADDVREAWESRSPRPAIAPPASLVYVDCTAGINKPVAARFGCAMTYWNTGSCAPDLLTVRGGWYAGENYGIRVIDFGPPFPGYSETEVLIDENVTLSGRTAHLDLPPKTVRRSA